MEEMKEEQKETEESKSKKYCYDVDLYPLMYSGVEELNDRDYLIKCYNPFFKTTYHVYYNITHESTKFLQNLLENESMLHVKGTLKVNKFRLYVVRAKEIKVLNMKKESVVNGLQGLLVGGI